MKDKETLYKDLYKYGVNKINIKPYDPSFHNEINITFYSYSVFGCFPSGSFPSPPAPLSQV
jgi:hypothetical protein